MTREATIPLEDLASKLQPQQRLLGFDLGTKTIGLALSDVNRSIATPMQTLKRAKFKDTARELNECVTEHNIGGFILGFPINMDGSEGPCAQATRAFAKNVSAAIDVPIVLWDERLSTVAAERALLEADSSRKQRAAVIDKMAAAFILQGALDRLRAL